MLIQFTCFSDGSSLEESNGGLTGEVRAAIVIAVDAYIVATGLHTVWTVVTIEFSLVLRTQTLIPKASLKYFVTFCNSSTVPLKINLQEISIPPWGRSLEYHLAPSMIQCMTPPRLINEEHMHEIVRGMWPTTSSPSLQTATAYLSSALPISCLQFKCTGTHTA